MMTIKVTCDIKQLTGVGEEWLTDIFGDVLAVFVDGRFRTDLPKPLEGETITAA